MMYIGKLAQLTGATRKAIHHYEALGLIPPPRRQGRYRVYGEADVQLIRTIRCAQSLGFSLKEVTTVLKVQAATGQLPLGLVMEKIEAKRQALHNTINQALAQVRQLAQLQQELEGQGLLQACPATP